MPKIKGMTTLADDHRTYREYHLWRLGGEWQLEEPNGTIVGYSSSLTYAARKIDDMIDAQQEHYEEVVEQFGTPDPVDLESKL